jgi:serine protease Do
MRDLPRAVAGSPVGKEVKVVIIRKGQEMVRSVTLGRLEDDEKPVKASIEPKDKIEKEKPAVQKVLGLDLAALTKTLRTQYKIRDSVKGLMITGVDPGSDAAEKRLGAGDVIIEIAQESVTNIADAQRKIEQAKKAEKKSVLLLVANNAGELRFVALNLQ